MSLLARLSRWFGDLFGGSRWTAELCEDAPDAPRLKRIYLVGEPEAPWSAALVCPCGCGEVIQLSLILSDSPSWTAAVARSGAVTLHPSIWRIRGCRSHFFVRDGRIIWTRDQRPAA